MLLECGKNVRSEGTYSKMHGMQWIKNRNSKISNIAIDLTVHKVHTNLDNADGLISDKKKVKVKTNNCLVRKHQR